ncbi:MAG: hypothetical protein IJQ55_00930 [Alphaproteobacteria bacterium]|nr:hypothetical protein [Alphaproteobacteria bacterium]
MSKEEKTITIPRKYVHWWICLTVVAIICFVGGWMLANYVKHTPNNNSTREQTVSTQERDDTFLYGGMSREKDREYWENYWK